MHKSSVMYNKVWESMRKCEGNGIITSSTCIENVDRFKKGTRDKPHSSLQLRINEKNTFFNIKMSGHTTGCSRAYLANHGEHDNVLHHWPFVRESPDAESFSITWRHHMSPFHRLHHILMKMSTDVNQNVLEQFFKLKLFHCVVTFRICYH